MKTILLIISFLCVQQWAAGQEIKKIKMSELTKMIDSSTTPLVINFWASWCAPCIHEIPWFEKNIAASGNKAKLILVSIDFADDYPKVLTAFAKKNGYKSEIVWLNETNADEFCPQIDKSWDGSIPATLLVNNKIQFRQFFGSQLPEEKFKEQLKKIIE